MNIRFGMCNFFADIFSEKLFLTDAYNVVGNHESNQRITLTNDWIFTIKIHARLRDSIPINISSISLKLRVFFKSKLISSYYSILKINLWAGYTSHRSALLRLAILPLDFQLHSHNIGKYLLFKSSCAFLHVVKK